VTVTVRSGRTSVLCHVRVRSLEALDGTPILDVKPVLAGEIDRR
jgi:tRNA (Thr-GGU) A37 N-methylase